MKNDSKMKRTTILTTVVCLIPVILGVILYNKLPDTIVTHWDINGNPNGWESKMVGAIFFPGGLVLLNIVFPLLLKIDPKYNTTNEKVKHMLHWIIPVVSIFCSSTTLATAMGKDVKVALIVPMFMGVFFVAIGNYLPKMTQSYTVGIKIPWTLNSEENWNRTHRMAGFLWVIGGIIMIITGALGMGGISIMVTMIIMVIVPIIYSYLLSRKGI